MSDPDRQEKPMSIIEYVGRPSGDDFRAYLDGEHGPPHPEVVAIIQDDLARAALCCCETSPPEFGGCLPDRDCPIHGEATS